MVLKSHRKGWSRADSDLGDLHPVHLESCSYPLGRLQGPFRKAIKFNGAAIPLRSATERSSSLRKAAKTKAESLPSLVRGQPS